MKIVKLIRQLLQKFDSFPATQFLRYQGETEYATATGGFFSLVVIVVFMILFTSTGLDVINKVNVTATSNFQSEMEPSPANLTAGPNGDFMFAIQILGINFSDPTTTVFEINLVQLSFTPVYKPVSQTKIPMVLCTEDHFAFTDQIKDAFWKSGVSNFLCPPLDYQFQLQGKINSPLFKQFSLSISKCNSTLHSNCMNDANMTKLQNDYGYFTIAVVVINKQLNPSSNDVYQSFYINDKNYFGFTTNLGSRVGVDVQAYEISTDSSLLPFSSQEVENGLLLADKFDFYPMPIARNTYFNMAFTKSAIVAKYNRTFSKIDNFLSYIGGLVGTLMGLLFIVGSYNQLCYQISLGNKLFVYDKEIQVNSNTFNITLYFALIIFKVCSWFGYLKDWMPLKKYQESSSEIEKQLDVCYLIKRLIFIERALLVLFEEDQFTALLLQSKPTLNELKKQREMMDTHLKLQKMFGQQNKVQNENNQSLNQIWTAEMGVKPIKFQPDISQSSKQSIDSNSLKQIKQKVKHIRQSSQLNQNLKKNKIFNLANKSLVKKIDPEDNSGIKIVNYKNLESLPNESRLSNGIQSQKGDISFQKIEWKGNIIFQDEGDDIR